MDFRALPFDLMARLPSRFEGTSPSSRMAASRAATTGLGMPSRLETPVPWEAQPKNYIILLHNHADSESFRGVQQCLGVGEELFFVSGHRGSGRRLGVACAGADAIVPAGGQSHANGATYAAFRACRLQRLGIDRARGLLPWRASMGSPSAHARRGPQRFRALGRWRLRA